MSGLALIPKTFAFDSSVPLFRNDFVQGAGTLVILDWSREDCWNNGVPRNLAADTAQALCGNPLHPTLGGRTQNIRRLNGMLGLGAEKASVLFPTALTDYMVGKNIGVSVFQRFVPTPAANIKSWAAGLAVNAGDIVAAGDYLYTVTVSGALGTSMPTHTSNTAANGGATLAWGLMSTSAGGYGTIGAITGSLILTNNYPADYRFFSSSNTAYTTPFAGRMSQWGINHVAASPSGSSINGVANASGRQLTTAQVPAPGAKALQISAELFNQGSLFGAAGGAVVNPNGMYLESARVVFDDLDVSARSFSQLVAADRDFFSKYHPARALLA